MSQKYSTMDYGSIESDKYWNKNRQVLEAEAMNPLHFVSIDSSLHDISLVTSETSNKLAVTGRRGFYILLYTLCTLTI